MLLKMNGEEVLTVASDGKDDFFRVTTEYGVKDSLHSTGHSGIDLATPMGTPIHSPIDGEVVAVKDLGDWNAGKYIKVRTEDGESDLIFGHLSEFKVQVGEHVDKGELLALSGNTGHSTGPHLHFGARDVDTGVWLDPSAWVDIFQEMSSEILSFIGTAILLLF
jgi:murein DD-endopeptidase MepM/ murein hydrolase activator NlpD